jgi:hypothetical protein
MSELKNIDEEIRDCLQVSTQENLMIRAPCRAFYIGRKKELKLEH